MKSKLFDRLLANGPVITDGAWGTQFEAMGLEPGQCADSWNLTHPNLVADVAKSYVDAGSRAILTNTFRANRLALANFNLADKTTQINVAGARISKQVAGDRAVVFASIGPSGKMLIMGEVTTEQLYDAFYEQAAALAEGGADAVVIETMMDPEEAKEAIRAVKAIGLPVVASMVFDSGKNKDRTMMGTTPEQAATLFTEAGADAVGANCGRGVKGYLSICQRMRIVTDLPIWIKANAGMPVLVDGHPTYSETPEQFAIGAKNLAQCGASFIGGCCGTSPKFITAINKALQSDD